MCIWRVCESDAGCQLISANMIICLCAAVENERRHDSTFDRPVEASTSFREDATGAVCLDEERFSDDGSAPSSSDTNTPAASNQPARSLNASFRSSVSQFATPAAAVPSLSTYSSFCGTAGAATYSSSTRSSVLLTSSAPSSSFSAPRAGHREAATTGTGTLVTWASPVSTASPDAAEQPGTTATTSSAAAAAATTSSAAMTADYSSCSSSSRISSHIPNCILLHDDGDDDNDDDVDMRPSAGLYTNAVSGPPTYTAASGDLMHLHRGGSVLPPRSERLQVTADAAREWERARNWAQGWEKLRDTETGINFAIVSVFAVLHRTAGDTIAALWLHIARAGTEVGKWEKKRSLRGKLEAIASAIRVAGSSGRGSDFDYFFTTPQSLGLMQSLADASLPVPVLSSLCSNDVDDISSVQYFLGNSAVRSAMTSVLQTDFGFASVSETLDAWHTGTAQPHIETGIALDIIVVAAAFLAYSELGELLRIDTPIKPSLDSAPLALTLRKTDIDASPILTDVVAKVSGFV